MARQKITPEPILKNYEEVDDVIREWKELDNQHEVVAQSQQEKIDEIKATFEETAKPIIARKMRLEKDLEDFAEYRKQPDFDTERSRKLTFGKIGFRASNELKCVKGFNWKKVLLKLKELGRTEFIKSTESVKRSDIKKSELTPNAMRMFGCEVVEKDEFYFEPDKDAISNATKKLELVRKAS